MSQFEKLFERFKKLPKDFTYDELRTLLGGLGYKEITQGKTSGSRVAFFNKKTSHIIRLHKPHPGSIVKRYALELTYEELKNQGVMK
jgi:hypothetical protein